MQLMQPIEFTESQNMLRQEVRNFAVKELAPNVKERHKLDYIPREIIKAVASMGLSGMCIPEKYGGSGADWVSAGVAIEEIAKVDFCLYPLIMHPAFCFAAIGGRSEELCQEWLPRLVNGDALFGVAFTEPEAGSDSAGIQMRAVRDGDYYILDGEKNAVTLGTQATVSVLSAKTDPSAGAAGVSCFLLPMDLPGIHTSVIKDMGWGPLARASVILEGVRLPAKYLIGEEGQGLTSVLAPFEVGRPFLGLASLGIAQAALESAINYVKQRQAFGKLLAKYEAISFKIAEDVTYVELARMLCYRTLQLRDRGLPHRRESAMCKWYAPMVATRAVHNSLLIHGHLGYSTEMPLERHLRDVIGFEMADGAPEIMKMIIAREMIGKEARPY